MHEPERHSISITDQALLTKRKIISHSGYHIYRTSVILLYSPTVLSCDSPAISIQTRTNPSSSAVPSSKASLLALVPFLQTHLKLHFHFHTSPQDPRSIPATSSPVPVIPDCAAVPVLRSGRAGLYRALGRRCRRRVATVLAVAVVVAVVGGGCEYVDVYAAALLVHGDLCTGLCRCSSQTFRAASSRAGDRSLDLVEVVVMSWGLWVSDSL